MRRSTIQQLLAIGVMIGAAPPVMADSASPQRVSQDDISIRAIERPSTSLIGRASYGTGFEPGEGFTPGWIDGQAGWSTFIDSDSQGSISTDNPFAGVQHLRMDVDPDLLPGQFTGAFSPSFGMLPPNTPSQVSVQVNISLIAPVNGADYLVVPQSPSQGLQSARILFEFTGDIFVIDDFGGTLFYVNTGFDWTPGVYRPLVIELRPGADAIDYFYGGQLIYSSVAWGGTNIEEVVILSDNWQNGDVGDFDNLVFGGLDAELAINSEYDCWDETAAAGGQVTFTIDMSNVDDFVAGGQFFLEYDPTVLDFVSIEPGDPPFTREVYEDVDEGAGVIDYAVGVPDGDTGSANDATMAVLTFNILQEICAPQADLVAFRGNDPPTRLSNPFAEVVPAVLENLAAISIDTTPPTISCPSDITVNADAGLCTAIVNPGMATGTDNCGVASITGERDDLAALSDPYPTGDTVITWTVMDDCGNVATCHQTITVEPYNEVVVDIEIEPNMSTASGSMDTEIVRCITFTLLDANCNVLEEVKEEVVFTFMDDDPNTVEPAVGSAVLLIDCSTGGQAVCITARDELHTLRRTDQDDFALVGAQFVADFTGGDALVSGNLNGDAFIDILDFGGFVGQFGLNVGSDTTCADLPIHADFSGNGTVGTEDFTFIQFNFLEGDELDCCGRAASSAGDGPVTTIAVRELDALGLGHLRVADLNGDGVLDAADIAAFLNGERPTAQLRRNRTRR